MKIANKTLEEQIVASAEKEIQLCVDFMNNLNDLEDNESIAPFRTIATMLITTMQFASKVIEDDPGKKEKICKLVHCTMVDMLDHLNADGKKYS